MNSARYELSEIWTQRDMNSARYELSEIWTQRDMNLARHELSEIWTQRDMNSARYELSKIWTQRDMNSARYELSEIWTKSYIGVHVKHSLFLSDLNETWIFSTRFRKIFIYQNMNMNMKILPVGAELFSADGRTDGRRDMTKLIDRFSQFRNTNSYKEYISLS